jgi:hypothetical protein
MLWTNTIQNVPSQKSARWVSKLLNKEKKRERERTREAFLVMVRRCSMVCWAIL